MRDFEAAGDHISELDDLALKALAKHTGGNYFWMPRPMDALDQMLFGTGERPQAKTFVNLRRPYEDHENDLY